MFNYPLKNKALENLLHFHIIHHQYEVKIRYYNRYPLIIEILSKFPIFLFLQSYFQEKINLVLYGPNFRLKRFIKLN